LTFPAGQYPLFFFPNSIHLFKKIRDGSFFVMYHFTWIFSFMGVVFFIFFIYFFRVFADFTVSVF